MWVRLVSALVWAVALGMCCGACAPKASASAGRRVDPQRLEIRGALRRLRAHEATLRAAADWEKRPPATRALGADPTRLCALGAGFVGLLRGSSELVLLDRSLAERARISGPLEPIDCVATSESEVVVVGSREAAVFRYRLRGGALELVERVPLPSALTPRAVQSLGSELFVLDSSAGLLFSLTLGDSSKRPAARASVRKVQSFPLCRDPVSLTRVGRRLIVNCLLEHALSIREVDAQGELGEESARIEQRGPFWGLTAIEQGDALLIAAAGVEDHPLERHDGAFGYVDSFIYLFRVRGRSVERVQAINVSDYGLLVPKALSFSESSERGLTLWATAYGSGRLLELGLADSSEPPRIASHVFFPGVSQVLARDGQLFAASPLLDAWLCFGSCAQAVTHVAAAGGEPTASVRLGEALAFTELIAPRASSDGAHSRFTCETCHFEGGIDGRLHDTGRLGTHVVTRPLFGLLPNAPHFSRALDPVLTSVSHNEFRVAGLGNPYDPWFSLRVDDFPWLSEFGLHGLLDAETLRRALIDFLAVFEPAENPRRRGRQKFSELEARGALDFRTHCVRCHAARLVSDDVATEVDFSRWESLIFSEAGPLVWARGDYEKTGVLPYVSPRGARVASLRRVGFKYPYFTNGSAHSLDEVLAAIRYSDAEAFHAAAPPRAHALSATERESLNAFLALL
jgi:hypothetical protein